MKTKYLFLAALGAITFASCTSDEFVGVTTDNSPTEVKETVINFGNGFKAVTRADNSYGADAAEKLNNKFIVSGVKGTGAWYTDASDKAGTTTPQDEVFHSYTVEWEDGSAGKTASNTANWEYVGKTNGFGVTGQYIKYWDFSTTAYNFAAYSVGTGSATGTAIQIDDYTNAETSAYTLSGTRANLELCYITDMKTVPRAQYQNEVELEFRSLASKVRMAIYETIPGYSVKDVFFFTSASTARSATNTNTDATLIGDAFYTGGAYSVYFPLNPSAQDYKKAHVTMDYSSYSIDNNEGFGTLNYVDGEYSLSTPSDGTDDIYLGRTLQTASFAGNVANHYYTTVLPKEDGTVLEMYVNYTLVSNDGSGEEITVYGAKAFVPQVFTKWLSNYAYTYIFKISDNTNGFTSPTEDPAGLFPITFDAVVLNPEETGTQTTITTVSTPSITTYQKGHKYNGPTEPNEYNSGKIYVRVMDNNASPAVPKADLDSKATVYTLSTGSWSEADVMDALNMYTASDATATVGRNGLTLTNVTSGVSHTITKIPGEDGKDIDVVTKTASEVTVSTGNYAYVYDATPSPAPSPSYVYSAEKYTSQPSDFPKNYYKINPADGSYEECAVGDYANDKYFYKRYTNQNKVYSVKIIKVQ